MPDDSERPHIPVDDPYDLTTPAGRRDAAKGVASRVLTAVAALVLGWLMKRAGKGIDKL